MEDHDSQPDASDAQPGATDAQPPAPDAHAAVSPLPTAGISKVLGLAEMLDDQGGRDDIYKLARRLGDTFGELLMIIKAGEVLGVFDTPGGDLVMLPFGQEILKMPVKGKREALGRKITELPLFEHFRAYLAARPEKSASRQEILDELARVLPSERPKAQYDVLLNWGRYAEFFGYSRDDDRFYLVEPPAP